jgi:hypothetical protein
MAVRLAGLIDSAGMAAARLRPFSGRIFVVIVKQSFNVVNNAWGSTSSWPRLASGNHCTHEKVGKEFS